MNRYGDIYNQTRGGQGTITQFNSHWKIKEGVADSSACALATHHNRLALKGNLDLLNERYENVTVALLDDKRCAKFKQSITGPFGSPKVGAVSAVESLAGPISSLYRKAKRFIQGGKVRPFIKAPCSNPQNDSLFCHGLYSNCQKTADFSPLMNGCLERRGL
jgi:AsmA protein